MKFELHSYEGAGPIRFGMTTAEVREILGDDFESLNRGETPYDSYFDTACFFYYDESGKVNAIEITEPGFAMLDGVDVLSLSFEDFFKLIKARDPEVKMDPDGFESLNLGIGCYAPMGDAEPENPAEAVIVFRRGYYKNRG